MIDIITALQVRGFDVEIHDSFADADEARREYNVDLMRSA